jgi:hypothetical protein
MLPSGSVRNAHFLKAFLLLNCSLSPLIMIQPRCTFSFSPSPSDKYPGLSDLTVWLFTAWVTQTLYYIRKVLTLIVTWPTQSPFQTLERLLLLLSVLMAVTPCMPWI